MLLARDKIFRLGAGAGGLLPQRKKLLRCDGSASRANSTNFRLLGMFENSSHSLANAWKGGCTESTLTAIKLADTLSPYIQNRSYIIPQSRNGPFTTAIYVNSPGVAACFLRASRTLTDGMKAGRAPVFSCLVSEPNSDGMNCFTWRLRQGGFASLKQSRQV
ncbi:hypothetical protein ACMFMG_005719 [Clarireedia jacksonii]